MPLLGETTPTNTFYGSEAENKKRSLFLTSEIMVLPR